MNSAARRVFPTKTTAWARAVITALTAASTSAKSSAQCAITGIVARHQRNPCAVDAALAIDVFEVEDGPGAVFHSQRGCGTGIGSDVRDKQVGRLGNAGPEHCQSSRDETRSARAEEGAH